MISTADDLLATLKRDGSCTVLEMPEEDPAFAEARTLGLVRRDYDGYWHMHARYSLTAKGRAKLGVRPTLSDRIGAFFSRAVS